MIPGMGHCYGGAGPTSIAPEESVDASDPKHDLMLSLEQWVEKGVAPQQVLAQRIVAGKVERTRPLCPYPQEAVWKGTGSTDDAANFSCALVNQ